MDTETAGKDYDPKTACGYCLRGEHNNCRASYCNCGKNNHRQSSSDENLQYFSPTQT